MITNNHTLVFFNVQNGFDIVTILHTLYSLSSFFPIIEGEKIAYQLSKPNFDIYYKMNNNKQKLIYLRENDTDKLS